MILAALIAATVILAAGVGVRLRNCWASWTTEDRAVAVMAIPATFILLLLTAHSISGMLFDQWSWVRLTPAAAILRGYALYYPEGVGPLLGWSYGPVVPLLQIPAAALPNPVAAVIGAGIMNELILLAPLFLLFQLSLPKSPVRPAQSLILLAAVASLMLHCAPSRYWLAQIQVDSYALGFSLLGLVVLLQPDRARPTSHRRIWVAGGLFGMAALSKQNEVFLLALPLITLWHTEGRSQMLRLALASATGLGLGIVASVAAWGWSALYLNLWLVPARHPWSMETIDGICTMSLLFVTETKGILLLFVALVLIDLKSGIPEDTSRTGRVSRPWALVALGGAILLPISVLGRLKIGGNDNAYHSLYYLFGAVGLLAARLVSPDRPRILRWGMPGGALLLALVAAISSDVRPGSLDQRFGDSSLHKEYAFGLEHRGEVFYSADPLVTLFTDGKLYHQGYGVFDRTLAQLPPTAVQLNQHLPARLRWVSTPGDPWWVPDHLVTIRRPPGFNSCIWSERKGNSP